MITDEIWYLHLLTSKAKEKCGKTFIYFPKIREIICLTLKTLPPFL